MIPFISIFRVTATTGSELTAAPRAVVDPGMTRQDDPVGPQGDKVTQPAVLPDDDETALHDDDPVTLFAHKTGKTLEDIDEDRVGQRLCQETDDALRAIAGR
ncbi:MAG: hypothetical protein E7Z97_00770 [Propionibacteriaceae bacterium]|nr:hypothetical protein [Propionibacteriaceae bacterium]